MSSDPLLQEHGSRTETAFASSSSGAIWRARRTFSLFSGALMGLAAGTLFSFGAYGVALKRLLNYSNSDLSIVSSIGDAGIFIVSVPIGLFYDKFGFRITSLVGGALLAGGYSAMSASVTDPGLGSGPDEPLVSPWLLGFYFFLVGLGSDAAYFSLTLVNVNNFPSKYQGRVGGLLVSLFGLSAAAATAFYTTFCPNDLTAYFAFLAFATGSLSVFGGLTMADVSTQSKSETQAESSPEQQAKDLAVPLTSHGTSISSAGDLIRLPAFQLLWFTMFVGGGTALTMSNALGTISESLGGTEAARSQLVIVKSTMSMLGRLTVGFASDLTLAHGMGRHGWIVLCIVIQACAMAVIAGGSTDAGVLTVITGIVGATFGGQATMLPVVATEFFGSARSGLVLGLLSTAPAFGTAWFGLISGAIYDAGISPTSESQHRCMGPSCHGPAFAISVASLCVAVVANLILGCRSSPEEVEEFGKAPTYIVDGFGSSPAKPSRSRRSSTANLHVAQTL